MSRKILAAVLVFLCFAPVMLLQIPGTNGETAVNLSSSAPAARSLTPHDTIYINGNSQFIVGQNGVVSGNGTEGNPYVIENWEINASSANGILIENTNMYFIIRNCVVHDGSSYNGIFFYIVQNGKIENVSSYNNFRGAYLASLTNNTLIDCNIYNNSQYGIYLDYSSNNNITNCAVYNNYYGIYLSSSSNNIITNCIIYNNCMGIQMGSSSANVVTINQIYGHSAHGIEIFASSNNNISKNQIYSNVGNGVWLDYNNNNITISSNYIYNNSENGILVDGSSNNNITSNCIYNNSCYGVLVDDNSDNNNITNCSIYNNGFYGICIPANSDTNIVTKCSVYNNFNIGVYVEGSNNYFYHNNIFVNTPYQASDTGANYWDASTIGINEGNYWGDYTGLDTNGDGIGDDPYYILGGSNKDDYPLMFPYPTKPNIKTSNLTLKSTAQGLKISANISNTDTLSDQTNFTVGFFVNASSVNTQEINILRNTTQTVFTYWQAQVGKYTIKVKADPENSVKEINELDNEVSTYIELSDVAVATEDITAAVVQNGIQLNVTLHNPGPALIGAPTYIYIDSKLEHQELVGVPAESINNLSFIWNGPSGDHDVLVVVDPENLFTEASETNNNATKTIYMLTGAPDLSIISTDIYFNPSTPVEGRNTTVTAIVHNVGYANASTATITFYDNENIIYTAALPAIQQGGQYPISTTFAAYNGHTIKVELTTTGIEYNLGNNYATIKINTVLPDLYIDSKNITITPSKPVEGGSTSITAKIYNMGEGTGEAAVQFFANSALIGEKQTGEISPGLSADVTIIWNNTTAGAIISIKILPTYPDAQSWNNEAETLLEETKTYTLIPKNITFSPDPPIQNQSTTVSVEIWNTGETSSPNAVISFYDGVVLISNESIGPVPPGEHLNVSATWAHAQKEHTIYVRIDISPNIASKLLLTTRMPDLTITNITFSEQYPENNKTILISITVKNQGNATSEQAELKVYAGDTLLQVITIAPLPAESSDTKEVSWQAQNLVRIKAEFTTSIDADTGNNFLDLLSPETTPTSVKPEGDTVWRDVGIWAIVGVIISGMFAGAFWLGKHLSFTAFLGFKRTGVEVLESPIRNNISLTAQTNPGMTKTWYSNFLGIPYSSLEEHLKIMEREGYINPVKEGNEVRIYPPQSKTPLSIEKRIIEKLGMCKSSIPQTVLASTLNLSIPTLRKHGQKLRKQKLIEIARVGKELHYKLTESGQAELKYIEKMDAM